MTDHHNGVGSIGINHSRNIKGPQAQLIGPRRGRMAREHLPLLTDVAAWVAWQQHPVAMAGQVGGPAFEALWGVPEPMGDHHQTIQGISLRLPNHHLKGTTAMVGGHFDQATLAGTSARR